MAPLHIDDDDDGKGNNVCLSSCNGIDCIKSILYLQVALFETNIASCQLNSSYQLFFLIIVILRTV